MPSGRSSAWASFKTKADATEEDVSKSQQQRSEREAAEAKELSDKASGKRKASPHDASIIVLRVGRHYLSMMETSDFVGIHKMHT